MSIDCNRIVVFEKQGPCYCVSRLTRAGHVRQCQITVADPGGVILSQLPAVARQSRPSGYVGVSLDNSQKWAFTEGFIQQIKRACNSCSFSLLQGNSR